MVKKFVLYESMEEIKELCFWIVLGCGVTTVVTGTVSVCLWMIIKLVRNQLKTQEVVHVVQELQPIQAESPMPEVPEPKSKPAPRKRLPKLKPGEKPCPSCGRAVSPQPMRVEASDQGSVAIHGCGKCGEVKLPLQAPSQGA